MDNAMINQVSPLSLYLYELAKLDFFRLVGKTYYLTNSWTFDINSILNRRSNEEDETSCIQDKKSKCQVAPLKQLLFLLSGRWREN